MKEEENNDCKEATRADIISGKIKRWQPSGDKYEDELHLYESQDMYDCCFQVGYQV